MGYSISRIAAQGGPKDEAPAEPGLQDRGASGDANEGPASGAPLAGGRYPVLVNDPVRPAPVMLLW